MPEYLTDLDHGIKDAIVVHLIERIGGVPHKLCTGEPYDNESTIDASNPRVFCEACRLAAQKDAP